MQATMRIGSSETIGRGRLLARIAIALFAAVALGFGLGHGGTPAGHAAPTVKVITVPIVSDQPVGSRQPSHGALP